MPMDIGRSLRILRARDQLTNKQIADHLGFNPTYVSKLCHSTATDSRTIDRLAEIFRMSASEFVALGETADQ